MKQLLDQIDSTKNEIDQLVVQQTDLQRQIDDWEVEPVDVEEHYDELLDDCYGEVHICGMSFDSKTILKELDPTAYRCGLLDYLDSLEKDRSERANHPIFQPYRDLEEELEDVECELDLARNTLEELEDELRELLDEDA